MEAQLAQEAPAGERTDTIGVVDPGFRLGLSGVASEREFRIWLATVSLVYLLGFLGIIGADYSGLMEPAPPEQRGQLEGPPSIDVEIVEAPSLDAKTKLSRAGPDAPPLPAPENPPQLQPTLPPEEIKQPTPPTPAETKAEEKQENQAEQQPEAEPEKQPEKAETPPEKAPDKPAEKRPAREQFALPDRALEGVDVSMKRYVEALDQAQKKKAQASQQKSSQNSQMAMLSGSSQIQGRAKSGRSDAYAQSVIAALIRSKPPPFALRGSVLVSFEIGQSGAVKYVKVLHSSGNTAMDQEAINAIRRAQFDPPPAGYEPADLTWIINYIFN